jgi:proteasome lid subunit RPN8/RPN11
VAAPGRIVLKEPQCEQIFQHCLAERPNEACALLAGQDERVEKVYLARNKEQSPVRYEVDPSDLLRIFRDIDDADLELLGILHSHVFTEAYPSQTDVRLAYYPDTAYLLVSLVNERQPVLRAFTILDEQISEIEVVVRP